MAAQPTFSLLPAQQRFIHVTGDKAVYDLSSYKYDVLLDISLYQGGFGSGKTKGGVLRGLLLAQKLKGSTGLVCAKTYPMVRDTTLQTYFEVMDALNFRPEKDYIWEAAPQKLVFPQWGNSCILFRHLEKPWKLKSLTVAWAHVEEMSEIDESSFDMLQSRIRQHGFQTRYLFGTSNPQPGRGWIWKKFVDSNRGPRLVTNKHTGEEELIVFRRVLAPSTENTHLPASYLENMRAQYSDNYYRMNVLGQDTDFREGLVCTSWSEANEDETIQYNPELTLYLTCDFNIDPMCWELAHRTQGPQGKPQYLFFDEICLPNTNLVDACAEFISRYHTHRAGVRITGDASGQSRSDMAKNPNDTKYKVMLRELSSAGMTNVHLDVPGANPPVDLRIETWNGLSCNTQGVRRIRVNPKKCPKLIWNMNNVKYIPGSGVIWEPTAKQIEVDTTDTLKYYKHPFDAASYLTCKYDSIQRDVTPGKPHRIRTVSYPGQK